MDNLKKYGFPAYILWSAISLILVLVYIVVNFCFEKPLTSGYEYFDSIKIESDNLEASDELPIIELNIARSDTNPELNLTEMIITEYTDYEHNSYKRYGMQVRGNVNYVFVGGQKFDTFDNVRSVLYGGTYRTNNYGMHNTLHLSHVYFYEIDFDGDIKNYTSYADFETQVNEDRLDVTAGDQNFKLEIGGADAKYTYENLTYKKGYWKWWANLWDLTTYQTKSNEYEIYDLFGYLATAFDTKESNKVISFDNENLDKFFTITKDNGSGQFYSLSDVTTNSAYFRIKCTYTNITSHLNAKDHSIIGAIAEDVNYSSGVVNMVTPYYSTGVELTLTGNEFIPTRYQGIDGAILAMTPEFKSYLLSLNNLTLNVRIDLDSLLCDEEIVGIDLSSLSNLKIQNLKVDSDTVQNFYIIGASRYIEDATYSSNLTLLNSTGGAYEQGN